MPTNNYEDVTISVSEDSDTRGSVWVFIEPEKVKAASVNTNDLVQMYSLALSGVSARSYLEDGCNVTVSTDGTVETFVNFYVWPSDPALEMTIGASIGDVVEKTVVARKRNFDIIVAQATFMPFPFYCSGAAVISRSPCYDAVGNVIPEVGYTITPTGIEFEEAHFSILTISATAHGFYCKDLISFDDTYNFDLDSKNAITNVEESALVTFQAEDGTTETVSEPLEIPPCVAYLLETCPGTDDLRIVGSAIGDDEKRAVVYYATCTGAVILVDYEKI